jgi:UDP-N-acetylmuramate: L-alanyl-gamma-D-glutamyl-meso-diaminopimelate ligase
MNANSPKLPKKLHVIGICGVAMSALAIAFHKRGVIVTGSDKGFFPPVSTELEKQGISYYAGWHPEKMFNGDLGSAKCKVQSANFSQSTGEQSQINENELTNGDYIVIVGTASGTGNPETALAIEKGIPTYSFPEVIGKYFAKEKSILCVGTWGKTSSSALLSFILEQARLDPTYMFGGISLSHDSSAKLTDSSWSVFEGDEYKSSPTDPRAKFFHYKATHLLLSAISWDHADLYPTEELYFDAFKKLIATIPLNGLIVACADHEGVMKTVESFSGKIVFYGRELPAGKLPAIKLLPSDQGASTDSNLQSPPASHGSSDYSNLKSPSNVSSKYFNNPGYSGYYGYKNVTQTKDGLDLTISHDGKDYSIHSPMLGLYQSENITGCFAMAHSIGVTAEKIVEAITKFKGLKRRMEKRFESSAAIKTESAANDLNDEFGLTVIDDIAHSPEKASSVLQTLRSIYPGKVTAIFEPNIGGRSRESAAKYDRAFENADIVVIPRLTKLKVTEGEKDQPMEGEELAATIRKTHKNVEYIDDDEKLVEYVISHVEDGDVIAFLGSHGFRGMIEETVKRISNF